MTIEELRRAFNLSSSYIEQIRQFKRSRIDAITHGKIPQTPVNLPPGVMLVCHVIPLSFEDGIPAIDIGVSFGESGIAHSVSDCQLVAYGLGASHPNLDGFVLPFAYTERTKTAKGYCQVFLSGAIELVELVRAIDIPGDETPLYVERLEQIALPAIYDCLLLQRNLGIQPPVLTTIDLVAGYKPNLACSTSGGGIKSRELPSPNISLGEVALEDRPNRRELATKMRPLFDVLANIAGCLSSNSYRNDGTPAVSFDGFIKITD